jgi:SAM-dependent methyltransferase
MEWGDYLFEAVEETAAQTVFPPGSRTVPFYRRAAELVSTFHPTGGSVLEIGGATGRFALELWKLTRAPSITVVEASHKFRRLAMELRGLRANEHLISLGFHHTFGSGPPRKALSMIREALLAANIEVCSDLTEVRGEAYDTVVLLNVIDRASRPDRLISNAIERTVPGGRLVISCPFAYIEPDDRDIYNILDFLPTDRYLIQTHLDYIIREGPRKVVHHLSQFVITTC